ncbi:MAG TPA: LPS assembly protein LptD [Azospirillaceae bacterium]|nr:LPS assembly protein LptD [Azospirillaceae bacterium]
MRDRLLRGAALALVLSLPAIGSAVAQAPAPATPAREDKPPVLFNADTLTHDEELGIVTATGNVELSQGTRILLADTVSYSPKNNVVVASGNVRMLEGTGEVIFADYVELTEDMGRGFIDNVRILMADNARIAGAQGERLDGRYTRISRAVYSPCSLCKDDPTRPPLWQIRAARVTHDQEKRDIYYRDAVMELFGVPVAYVPFFAHPDPTVERRSGFLAPGGGHSSDLGTFARAYYYWDIGPSMDATFEVTPSTEDGLLLGGEWRQRFGNGSLTLSGSGTYATRFEGFGEQRTTEKDFRGHLFGTGRFDLDEAWRWGFDLQRVTDNAHLRRYDYSDEDLLRTRIFAERFVARDYLAINAYSFQDLRPGNPEEEPTVAPLVTYSALGEPNAMLGGRWSLDANLLSLTRGSGIDTRRASTEAGWMRSFVAPIGLVSSLGASARADAYHVTDLNSAGIAGDDDSLDKLRLFARAHFTTSLPMARTVGTVNQLVEPIVSLTAAPRSPNVGRLPNEDSQDVEFDHTNLFLPSRFPGIDRLEGGQRVTYGVRAGLYGFGGGSSTLFFGQSYRLQRENDYPGASGLDTRLSDYVGRIEITPSPWIDVSYGFRLDNTDFQPRQHDLFGVAGPPQFRVSGNYLFIDRLALEGGTASRDREEITLGINSTFSQNWSAGISHRRDLAEDGGPISTGLVLTYQDECFAFQLVGERDFTRRSGIESGDRVFFRLVFKNLGEFVGPSLSGTGLLGPAETQR